MVAVPDAVSTTSAASSTASVCDSTTRGGVPAPRSAASGSNRESDRPGARATTSCADGTRSRMRRAAAAMSGRMRRSSLGRLPGSSATTGVFAPSPCSRRNVSRPAAAGARSSRGWPTKETGIPASRYSRVSNGKMTRARVTNRRMARNRPLRHAHACGPM